MLISHIAGNSSQCCRLIFGCRSPKYFRFLASSTQQKFDSFYYSRRSQSSFSPSTDPFPSEARVVIAGGGVVGCSVAYHLAKRGWKDIVLLEQGRLSCGSTWAASGIVGLLRASLPELAVASSSIELYRQLHEDGHDIGLRTVGALSLCRKPDRVTAYKRSALIAQRFGIESLFLSPTEVKARIPIIRTEDLLGAMWIPDDSIVDPSKLTAALAKEAMNKGAQIFEKCRVHQVTVNDGRVSGVETNHGHISCEVFVNCAGQWAHDLGQRTNIPVRVPLHACEHTVIYTKPFAGVAADMPIVRDYDGYVYMRQFNGGLLGSGFPPIAKPAFRDGIPPPDFEFKVLPEDWDYFKPLLDQLLHRVPVLATVEAKEIRNMTESFTPDGHYVMGPVPEVDNYFVAAGMNATGLAAAGGIGKYLAEWIMNDESSVNMWMFDIRRFVDLHNNKKFLRERVVETFGTVAHVPYWEAEMIGYDSGRRLRTSAIFTRNEPYAVFGQTMAYERPLYFHTTSMVDDDADSSWTMPKGASIHGIKAYELHETGLPQKGTYGKPSWFDNVRSEYWACRQGVCLIDMSTFTKFELRSPGNEVVKLLQYVCSNDVDCAVGMVIHTGMQNMHGGFENDCSVIRLAHNRYMLVGPTAQQTRCYDWIRDRLPRDGSVQLSDVTSMYTALDLIGPKAQELLQELTDTPLGRHDFMHMTCKTINVGLVSGVKAMRLTHTGEDGFMLYIPSEMALHVYDSLMTYGKNYGLRSAGYYALRALRTEKFFAYWGTDLRPQDTPLECGREFRVKFDMGGFIGYPALARQRDEGIRKRLVQFVIEDHVVDEDPWPWGGEPIYRNGTFCGLTTSTAFGFGIDRHICLGYVHDYDPATGAMQLLQHPSKYVLDKGARYEINIAGKTFPARAYVYPVPLPPISESAVPL